MSPLARTLLELCDETLTVDIERVNAYHTALNIYQVKAVAIMLGLRIKGGS